MIPGGRRDLVATLAIAVAVVAALLLAWLLPPLAVVVVWLVITIGAAYVTLTRRDA